MLLLLACTSSEHHSVATTLPTGAMPIPRGSFVLHGGQIAGQGPADVQVEDGKIVAVGVTSSALPSVDVTGRWLAPAFIDSHVHLAYLPEGSSLAHGGIAAAVDLASPLEFLSTDPAPLQLLRSGPMLTAPGGYPTQGWGRNGYGLECPDPETAVAAVNQLATLGAGVIKLPIDAGPALSSSTLRAITEEAHRRGLRVASHALDNPTAALAADVGVDILAHTPVGVLTGPTIEAWQGKAVVTTLAAFGGSSAVANLLQLRAAGATILYGTDFGNTRELGISAKELRLLRAAGMDGTAILDAGTSIPAAFWGFDTLGSIAVGKAASLLVLEEDPLVTPETLSRPLTVLLDGRAM